MEEKTLRKQRFMTTWMMMMDRTDKEHEEWEEAYFTSEVQHAGKRGL